MRRWRWRGEGEREEGEMNRDVSLYPTGLGALEVCLTIERPFFLFLTKYFRILCVCVCVALLGAALRGFNRSKSEYCFLYLIYY